MSRGGIFNEAQLRAAAGRRHRRLDAMPPAHEPEVCTCLASCDCPRCAGYDPAEAEYEAHGAGVARDPADEFYGMAWPGQEPPR